jgi:spore germination protein
MKRFTLFLCTIALLVTGCQGGSDQTIPMDRLQKTRHQGDSRNTPEPITPSPVGNKVPIETNGYLEPAKAEKDRRILNGVSPHLSYVSFFSYRVRPDGSLIPPRSEAALNTARKNRARPMMVITNFTEGNFSPDVTRALFTRPGAQERLIRNVLRVMREKGFTALNVDFEHLYPEDRERYNRFLRAIAPHLRREGYLLSTALAPKTSGLQTGAWYGGHDYAEHGRIADFVILMTYEWGWSGGPPMAVAPIPQVRRVLDYAVSVIPREKIMLGVPLYGYDWTLPYRKGGEFARKIDPVTAEELARRHQTTVDYDETAQAPTFRYRDDQGKDHVVWYEDKRSLQAKFDLVKQYRLRGVSYWVLGDRFPDNWRLLREQFRIRKAG